MDDKKLTHQDTNTALIAAAGLVGAVLLVIALIWLKSYFYLVRNEVEETQVLTVDNPKLKDLRAREREELTTYGWVDQDKGTVRIPIERAMELVAAEEQRNGGQGE